jgi:hypothetical protein
MSSSEPAAKNTPEPDSEKESNPGNPKNAAKRNASFFHNVVGWFFSERKSKFRAGTFGAIGAFFGGWGALYYNNRHIPPWVPVILVSVGGIFVSLAARQVLVNNGKSDRVANAGLVVVITMTALFAGCDLWFEYRPEPAPAIFEDPLQFKLGLSFGPLLREEDVGAAGEHAGWLTNAFLIMPDPKTGSRHSTTACMFIPVPADGPRVRFRLFALNPNSNDVDRVEIQLFVDDGLKPNPDPNDSIPETWTRITEHEPGSLRLGFQKEYIPASRGLALPSLTLSPLLNVKGGTITILQKTKTRGMSGICFGMWFITNAPFNDIWILPGHRIWLSVTNKEGIRVSASTIYPELPPWRTGTAPSSATTNGDVSFKDLTNVMSK